MAANPPRKLPTPDVCPVCGEDVPPRALACPECGADHRSGWREDADAYHGIGLPDGDFDYDEFVWQEFGKQYKPSGLKPIWWITGLLVLIAIVLTSFRVFFFFPF